MKVEIITCHDVYNVGAGLQAYALQTYLTDAGHDVEIIDYKPDYLSRHYRLDYVANPKYDRPVIRQLYLLAKLWGRLRAKNSDKKKQFDAFRSEKLRLSGQQYHSNEDLRKNCPAADVYIAGSDQIWNPLFDNGKDPAFFLDFVKKGKRISYAASFAVDELPDDVKRQDQAWLSDFNAVSVREKSGVKILDKMGISAVQTCDPVFLLDTGNWNSLMQNMQSSRYAYIYDFDGSNLIDQVLAEIKPDRIVSYFNNHQADVHKTCGPEQFLGYLFNAETVISNSFHATAFSLIFHKEFYVVGRKEAINTRMIDLLETVGLRDRYITDVRQIKDVKPIDWQQVDRKLQDSIASSKVFLERELSDRRSSQ